MFLEIKDMPEKAKRIFQNLIEIFAEQDITPTPLNYYVWYQYYKGDIPKFRQEMDAILDDPFGYTDRVGRRLYDEYLSDSQNEMTSEFDLAFKRLVDAVVKKLNALSERLEDNTRQLDSCTSELSDPNLSAEEVKKITHTVLSTANSMQQTSESFKQEMENSSQEVRSLRQQLIEARAEAMQDELTEVGNRKAFNSALQEMMLDAEEKPESLCMIFTDIDHFKKFNDTYGHLVGDSVLRYFANVMKKSIDENETVCRYGGEEFAIIMAESSLPEAQARAETIRKGIESAHLKRKNENKPLNTITASFGVAVYQGKNDTADAFIARADKALYQAKNNGRNQVVLETELNPEPQ